MRAIIYTRVSSRRQVDEGHGLESQEQLCRNYAASKGYDVIAVFREEAVSGGLFERETMKQLLKFLEEHDSYNDQDKIVTIFDDLKRIARDVAIHFAIKREIYGRNAIVESPNFNFEDSPEGKFVETVMAATAELERNQNKRQVIQKMKARLQSGYWPFCPPLGLKFTQVPGHGKLLTPKEPFTDIYKTAIEQFSNRILRTPEEVRDYIQKEYEIRDIHRKISKNGASKILRKILYTGYIYYPHWNIPLMKAKHEGFISIETYTTVQEILDQRAKPKSRIDTNPDFPLRNLVLCSLCNKPLTGSWNTGQTGAKYANYFCKTENCALRWKVIHKEDIEKKFDDLIRIKEPYEGLIELATDIFANIWEQRQSEDIATQKQHQNDLQSISDDILNLTKRITKTTNENVILAYEEELSKLVQKKKGLEAISQKPVFTKEQFGTASEKVLTALKNPLKMWKSTDKQDRLTIFSMYFDSKPVYDKNTGFGTSTLSSPIATAKQSGGFCSIVE